MLSSKSLLSIE